MPSLTADQRKGHLLAAFTILIWGTTFLSTTVLLRDFNPYEILFVRMVLGVAALTVARPKRLKLQSKTHEWYFAGAGLFGVTLYFMLENFALTYTYSANCSVIISTAPFFVAIALRLFGGGERMGKWFFVGFAVAIVGVGLIAFSGQELRLNPMGDVLCLLAAMSWAGYNVMLKKLEPYRYDTLLVTRRIFFYGLLFLCCALPYLPFSLTADRLFKPLNLFNFLYLGLCASALCYVTWSKAIGCLGALKTSAYIYLSPAVTIVAARLLLNDPILPAALAGAALTLAGLVISERGAR